VWEESRRALIQDKQTWIKLGIRAEIRIGRYSNTLLTYTGRDRSGYRDKLWSRNEEKDVKCKYQKISAATAASWGRE
jgi:hypothetical protein